MIRSSTFGVPYKSEFTNGSQRAVADLPALKGGAGDGFGPHELLEAAYATCLTMTVQMYAAKHGIPLRSATSEVRIDRSNPDAVTLVYELTLDGPLTEAQIAQLRAAASSCPVGRTLTSSIALRPATS